MQLWRHQKCQVLTQLKATGGDFYKVTESADVWGHDSFVDDVT